MQTPKDSRGYYGYRCGNYGREPHRCPTGQASQRISDPALDQELEKILGDLDTLTLLIEESAREAERRAESPPAETTRLITEGENRKRRVKDAYVAGTFDLEETQKRLAAIDGELSILHGLLAHQERAISIDPDAVVALVDVFSSWRDLDRRTKRDLLRSFGIRIFITKIRRGQLHVERIQIRSLDEALIYKKMKRLDIE
jgi:hypothetical protein